MTCIVFLQLWYPICLICTKNKSVGEMTRLSLSLPFVLPLVGWLFVCALTGSSPVFLYVFCISAFSPSPSSFSFQFNFFFIWLPQEHVSNLSFLIENIKSTKVFPLLQMFTMKSHRVLLNTCLKRGGFLPRITSILLVIKLYFSQISSMKRKISRVHTGLFFNLYISIIPTAIFFLLQII